MRNLLCAALSLLLCACAAERQPGELFGPVEDHLPVVDAILLVGHPLPDLFLRRSLPPARTYASQEAALESARVRLLHKGQVFVYSADPDAPGRYLPPPDAPRVQERSEYALEVDLPDGRQIRARTRTPPALQIRAFVLLDEGTLQIQRRLALFAEVGEQVYEQNRIVYPEGLLEMRLDEDLDVPAFQLAIFNLEADSEFLIEASFLEEDDLEDFERQGASPPLEARDGRARLPWFAVAYAGRHLFKIYAVDRNWFDFIRTDPDSDGGGFGGLAGDQFQRPVFHIEGGIGLFASASLDSVGFTVEKRSQ